MSRYQKLSQREHVLARPDTYIGSVAPQTKNEWVYVDGKIIRKDVTYPPALLKIFDEIITNSADCYNRDKKLTVLKVCIDEKSVSVHNDGCNIPIEKHDAEKCYIPELIFGHLLAGENFDDSEQRTGAGRNGIGSKATNIFSKKFDVEICDGKKKYKQSWENNMSVMSKPKVTTCSKDSYITTTFFPDFERFGIDSFDDDTMSIMVRRVYDMAAVLNKVKVMLNGKRLEIKNTEDYFSLYVGNKTETKRAFEHTPENWDVAVSCSDEFTPVSFVNSVVTRGGTHVNAVTDAVAKAVVEAAAKKKIVVKPATVKGRMFVFVNATVFNPTFDSQTKENLTSRNARVTLSDTFVKKAVGVLLDAVIQETNVRTSLVDQKELKKTDGAKKSRVSGIPKLNDAAWAGTKNSKMCTLILTEGDSAATLAIAGLSVVGRERYGVFPLRGKLLNVRDASVASITKNEEITALKQILGLQTGKVYKDTSSLRYGHVMIMTDADVDGTHISGLVMNFFHSCFPSLLEIPGFLKKFITPIVVAKRGKDVREFYSLPDYEDWVKTTKDYSKYQIKYYKGLGTSSSTDAKHYFSNLKSLMKTFTWTSDSGELIDRSFNKTRAEDRKEWMTAYEPGNQLDHKKPEVPVPDFIDKELILFSRYDLERSIPSVVDGFKPSQRKVLYSAFKRNLTTDVKVAQFSGYVAEHSAYHHGEVSLQGTIVNLAQDYVGSNNINWLLPEGQFGSRLQGGKDHASARYIFTKLNPKTRQVFVDTDDNLLKYLYDDGDKIEPEYYVPIIPSILVNGSSGIGTGWSTNIPSYNPKDIVDNVKRLISGEDLVEMKPWYRGFKGKIEETSPGVYVTKGLYMPKGKTIMVSELPVGKWTQDYKEYLDGLLEKKVISDFREKHSDTDVLFEIDFVGNPNIDILKLETTIRSTNMHAFDPSGKIKKYDTPLDIIRDWFEVRRNLYVKRKAYLLEDLTHRTNIAQNKHRFITMVNNDEIIINKKHESVISAELEKLNFYKVDGKYDYLLNMRISSLTLERATELEREAVKLNKELDDLSKTTETDMWKQDLTSLDKN
ncbi:DNA topoisomerase II [Paramecium bursaria Chlorella virus CvsA1]|nr:DNA topoisomerase II [Paramecium bursaria Chlorella virus CvsA1]